MAAVEYDYPEAGARWEDDYVWNGVARELRRVRPHERRVFELGCGNGITAARMRELGFSVTAVDPSQSGIRVARTSYPPIAFEVASVDDPLAERFGRFPVVVSVEVVEHCFSPKRFAECVFELLEPGGHLILTTPYHGYLKNLALALAGKMDAHYGALWEGGHIKFFSEPTIRTLLTSAGFEVTRIGRLGRIAPLAKSMIVTARKPR